MSLSQQVESLRRDLWERTNPAAVARYSMAAMSEATKPRETGDTTMSTVKHPRIVNVGQGGAALWVLQDGEREIFSFAWKPIVQAYGLLHGYGWLR